MNCRGPVGPRLGETESHHPAHIQKLIGLLDSISSFRQSYLLRLKNVKFLEVGDGADDVGGKIAGAIENARGIGLPLAQRQRDVGALQ